MATSAAPTSPAAPRLLPLALLSGACALVYQIGWTRELRLVFGASTLASAAVVAIFIGGLGLGARILGDRVEASATPLRLYARLELGIALSSATTPLLLAIIRRVYIALGGSVSLGAAGATAVRLLLTALVLAAPTVLMGGTLPALAKAAMAGGGRSDPARRSVGLPYGVNTLGAVAGCMLATFVLLERLGTRRTLWAAALLNALVALAAQWMARREGTAPASPRDEGSNESDVPAWVVCGAAAAAGFAFFLMELVFTRLLTPLLGGTVYTFGLVLAVALLGIGVGGALYAAMWRRHDPDVWSLAGTSLGEAFFLAVPYALGDRIAVLAVWARPAETTSMGALLPGWLLVTAVVVFPSAVVAGLQFPVLVSLLGHGRAKVARHVGRAYAWNTLGAMAGAIAGGFGLMPALTAVGCWKLAGGVLITVAFVAIFAQRPSGRSPGGSRAPFVVLAVAMVVFVSSARGPTAAWRGSSIGVGRVSRSNVASAAAIVDFVREQRESVVWEVDGIESSISLQGGDGYSFLTNGKSDGHCVADAGTQIMGGVLAALLRPGARSAMVIGLGSGSSAGWLGQVPGIERVDAVELEPAMVEVARRCAAVNGHVLDNPRVHLVLGDAREVLSVTPARYDVVFSEPSNPYRAGVASLYTREYYERVRAHLEPGGVFAQWVQAYEIDADTLRTILATMASAFPYVEVWQLEEPDLTFVASEQPIAKEAAMLRARVAGEPFRRALQVAWKVDDLEGVLAHFVATPALAAGIAAERRVPLNTDDRTVAEFGFARAVDAGTLTGAAEVRQWALDRGVTKPAIAGEIDWQRVGLERSEIPCVYKDLRPYADPQGASDDVRARLALDRAWARHEAAEAVAAWDARAAPDDPPTPIESLFLAEASLRAGDVRAEERILALASTSPLDALALEVRWLESAKLYGPAQIDLIEQALHAYRTDPWAYDMWTVVSTAETASFRGRDVAVRMVEALSQPFAAGESERARTSGLFTAVSSGLQLDGCMAVLAREEGALAEDWAMMSFRADCYGHTGDPRAAWAQAAADRKSRSTKDAAKRWPWEL